MKQTRYHSTKGRVGLYRLLSMFVTLSLVAGLVPSQSIAYAREGLAETDGVEVVEAVEEAGEDQVAEPKAEEATADDEEQAAVTSDQEAEAEAEPAQVESEGAAENDSDDQTVADEATVDESPEAGEAATEAGEEAAPDKKADGGKLTVKAGDATVSASYDEGTFEGPVTLHAENVDKGDARYGKVTDALDELAETNDAFDYDHARALDIWFENEAGEKVEPAKDVRVSINLGEAISQKAVSTDLVHIPDDGPAELIDDARVADDGSKATFANDEFSVYVVTAEDPSGNYSIEGGAEFDSFAEAVEAANDGDVILVTEDVTEEDYISIGLDKHITLLPYDKDVTITFEAAVEISGTNGGLTIGSGDASPVLTLNYEWYAEMKGDLDFTLNDGAKIQVSDSPFELYGWSGNLVTATINGGTIERTGEGEAVSVEGTNLTMNGGTIIAHNGNGMDVSWQSVEINGGTIISESSNGSAVYISTGQKTAPLTIKGGTFIGHNAVDRKSNSYNNYPATPISGGVFKANGGYAFGQRVKADLSGDVKWCGKLDKGTYTTPAGYDASSDTVQVSGIDGDFHYLAKEMTITYDGNGGKTSSNQTTVTDATTGAFEAADNNFIYEGHVFKEWNTSSNGSGDSYVEGAQVTPTGDMTLYAIWDTSDNAVSIGDTYYNTITEAMAEAQDGDTIVVHKSVGEPGPITFDKNVTIVTDANKVVVTNAKFNVPAEKNLELGGDENQGIIEFRGNVGVSGTLTVNNQVVVKSPGSASAVSVSSGGTYYGKGGTFSATSSGNRCLDLGEGSRATITGGSYTGDDVALWCAGTVDEISNASFSGVNATDGTGARFASGATVDKISDCTFTAGGPKGKGLTAMGSESTPVVIKTIEKSTFVGGEQFNAMTQDNGFGLYLSNYSTVESIDNCELSGGCGVYLQGVAADVTTAITNSTLKGKGDGDGGRGLNLDNKSRESGSPEGHRKCSVDSCTITGDVGVQNFGDEIAFIKNTEITATGAGVLNYSSIGSISSCTIESVEEGIENQPYSSMSIAGHIGSITDTDVTSSEGIALSNVTTVEDLEGVGVDAEYVIGSITNGSFVAHENAIHNRGSIGTISGDTNLESATESTICNLGKIHEITGDITATYKGTYWSDAVVDNWGDGVIDKISGGTFNGGSGMAFSNNGLISEISEGTFSITKGYYNDNYGTISKISGGTYEVTGDKSRYAIYNNSGATIGEISDGTFTADRSAIVNAAADADYGTEAGAIETISGGTFTGGQNGLKNDGAIDAITGGNFTGNAYFGIWNDKGTIGKIAIAEGTTSVFKGVYAGVGAYDGVNVITGHGVFVGGSWNAVYGNKNVEFSVEDSLDLTKTGDNPGYGRYHYDANEASGELSNASNIPTGYHMSNTTTSVTGQSGAFRFLTKNNTIIYDGNGHELASDSTYTAAENVDGTDPVFVASENSTATVLGNDDLKYSPDDLTFIGWSTTADGTGDGVKFFKAGDTLDFTELGVSDIRLYALWGPKITYKSADAAMGTVKRNVEATQQVDDNNNVTEVIAPSEPAGTFFSMPTEPKGSTAEPTNAERYQFVKWVDADGSQVSTSANYAPSSVPTKNVTYTATFTKLWDVTFDADGGAPEPAKQKVVDGEKATKPATDPSRTGYDFDQWHEVVGGTMAETAFDFATEIIQDTILKAKWNAHHYTVHFDANAPSDQQKPTGTMGYQTFTYDVEQALTANAFERPGYTWTGWNTEPDGSGDAYGDAQSVKNLTAEDNGKVTLYAQWTANDSKIAYDANGGTGETADTEGKTDETVKVAESGFGRTGYTFNGWNTEPDGSGDPYQPGDDYTLPPDGTTLYAQWTQNHYTVTFDSNATSGQPAEGSTDDMPATYDEPKSLPENGFTRDGYTFTGWNTEPDGSGTGYADKAEVLNLASEDGATVTLYAQWAPNDSRISYNANGGEGETADTTGKTDEVVTVADNGFTREGYTFAGWNTEPDGSGKACQPGDDFTLLPEATVLYAQWEVNEYVITFDPNGGTYEGSADPTSGTHDYGDVITMKAPERDGYTFLYWKGSEYYVGDEYTVTEDHTFVAQWEKSEKPKPSPKPTPKPSPKPTPKKAIPQTGDPAAAMPLALFAGTGLGLLLAAAVLRRRRA